MERTMKSISAAEANRCFSSLLCEVSRGAQITVTSRGRPVATITAADQVEGRARVAARRALLSRLRVTPATGTGGSMREATCTEFRNHAKDYFDAVEGGDTVRVFRKGKPIAEAVPIGSGLASWKRQATPLTVKGLSLSREILSDRDKSA